MAKKKPNGKANGKANGAANGSGIGKPKAPEKQPAKQSTKPGPADHLKKYQFQPGKSGNPNGRPRKPSLVSALIRRLNLAEDLDAAGVERFDEDGKRLRPPTVEEVADNMLDMALRGNVQALGILNTLLDRLDGRVPLKAEITGKDGDPITVRHTREQLAGRIAGLVTGSRPDGDSPEPN